MALPLDGIYAFHGDNQGLRLVTVSTLYWHDYETWGENPARDKPAQFAGVRTDESLNIVGEPLVMYCQPSSDCLPKPEACLVTGLTPQQTLREGLPEYQFIARIHEQLARPGTCGVGYNSIRFDDEVTRYALYRNFYDPYEREWRNGNSRWDIIDMVRLTYALRPEGIEWPYHDDGTPSFKLEQLSQANGLSHESAHDALSDVHATIALAKLIRRKQANLYDYAYRLRLKKEAAQLIDLHQRKPLLHISSRFPASHGCAALVAPLAMHPINKNGVIVYNLAEPPDDLLRLSAEQIRERLYTRSEDLAEGENRVPLKVVHLNKSPMLVTPKMLDKQAEQRLQIDKSRCELHWQRLKTVDIQQKLWEVFSETDFPESSDPEQQLYQGFLDDRDKALLAEIRSADAKDLRDKTFSFYDQRLPELLFRYRARNFPSSLSTSEQQQWHEFVQQRLLDSDAEASLTLATYREQLAVLKQKEELTEPQGEVLAALRDYGDELEQRFVKN